MEQRISFVLPIDGRPRAHVVTDHGFRSARVSVGDRTVIDAPTAEALCAGVDGRLPDGTRLTLRAGPDDVRLLCDGIDAPREDALSVAPTRSAWIHASLALSASLFGFAAGALYVRRAQVFSDAWALKMAIHMAAWHLLLVLTLFPASVWGQRAGIRVVQALAALFFFIHAGIAAANLGAPSPTAEGTPEGPAIAVLNALSGLAFLATVVWGQRAHADMDPLASRGGSPQAAEGVGRAVAT
jgi:hypothetical protein